MIMAGLKPNERIEPPTDDDGQNDHTDLTRQTPGEPDALTNPALPDSDVDTYLDRGIGIPASGHPEIAAEELSIDNQTPYTNTTTMLHIPICGATAGYTVETTFPAFPGGVQFSVEGSSPQDSLTLPLDNSTRIRLDVKVHTGSVPGRGEIVVTVFDKELNNIVSRDRITIDVQP
jgi:hypothetical protein